MAANAWTKEENEQFKIAVQWFSAFLPNRFEFVARYLQKSVVDVMEHYQEMVDDLLAFADGMINAFEPSWCQIERPIWDKEEHEWFLIGLSRFGRDWEKIAVLLVTKSPMQVAIYARNFFTWHNSTKRRRTMEIAMGDTSVDSSGQQESLVPLQPQPQQGPVALETGQHGSISDSESNNLP